MQVRVFVNKTRTVKVINYCNMQSEFTALQEKIHDLKNLKQEFEKRGIFK